MKRLERAVAIAWNDLPRIERVSAARLELERAWLDGFHGPRIEGLEALLRDRSQGARPSMRDRAALETVLREVERGEIFLICGPDEMPLSPALRWEPAGDASGQRRWIVTETEAAVRSRLEALVRRLARPSPDPKVHDEDSEKFEATGWNEAVGGVKELVNRFVKLNAAVTAEWMAERGILRFRDQRTGAYLGPVGVGRAYAEQGKDALLPSNAAETRGAKVMRESSAAGAIFTTATALGTRLRSAARRPAEFVQDLEKALVGFVSQDRDKALAEALGKAALEQAKRRRGHQTDPRYVDRYHGPDDITKKDGRLTEWEAKGNKTNSRAVAKDVEGNKQGSKLKNAHRSGIMSKDKVKKVGLPSNRQGGPYTREEIDLWQEIFDLKGKKQHISVHANTETGQVRVYERDDRGNPKGILDNFKMERFHEMKQAIQEGLKQ